MQNVVKKLKILKNTEKYIYLCPLKSVKQTFFINFETISFNFLFTSHERIQKKSLNRSGQRLSAFGKAR